MAEFSGLDLRDVIAQVEIWMLRNVCNGGNRPSVAYSENGEHIPVEEIADVAAGMEIYAFEGQGATEAEAREILGLEPPTWKIEASDERGNWDGARVAQNESDNRFASEEAAQDAIESLRALGGEWATGEYRVVRAN